MMGEAKRTVKDTVFRDLFSRPRYLLQLYRALHPEDNDIAEQDLKIVTLQNILVNGIYNDLGFIAKDRLLVLVEAQSTWSPNIIIRSLLYLMSTYQEYFNNNDILLYGAKTIKMPKPELFVVYTQKKGNHPEVISFKEIFFPDEPCCIDAKAKVIYADSSDTIINQYIDFCIVLNKQVRQHGLTLTAIKNTIKICKDNNTLKEYLEHRETEVEGIMLTLFDQDRITELYHKEIAAEAKAEGWAEGKAEGRAEGKAEGKAEGISEGMAKGKIEGTIHTLKELVKDGFITVTVAAKRAGMTEEAFRKIAMM